jgi:hypothetical protein
VSFKVDTESGANLGFTKVVFKKAIGKRITADELVLVQNYGDESIGASFAHRNNKRNNKPYERTTPSKMAKLKE